MKTIRPDSVRRWGRMSSHQMVCHLADAFRMAAGQKTSKSTATAISQTVVKWIALYLPLAWPPGLQTMPEVDQEIGGTCPTDFASDLADVEKLVEAFTTAPRNFVWPAHPVFGPMSKAAWLRWGYLHTDHHLRQFGA